MTSQPADPGFLITIPARAPSGAAVTVEREERDGRHRLHASTPDGHEVYVEILAAPALMDHAEAAADQAAWLVARSAGARIEGPVSGAVGARPATLLSFDGELGGVARVRRFAFLDDGGRTFRVVVDPGSATNDAILASLVLPGDGAS